MAVVTTPLGFQKPDGNELVRQGDNVIAANAQKSQDLHAKARADIVNLQSAAGFDGDPLVMQDSVVAALVGSNTETGAAVEVVAASAANEAVGPIAADVATKASKVELTSTADSLSGAGNKSFTTRRKVSTPSMPEHYITTLSNATLTKESIVHINALDSTAAIVSVRETLSSMYARKQPNVLINAGGWWPTDRRMGLSIHNGVLVQDWDYGQPNWGVQAMVFYRDGTMRCEDSSTPGATLVANGAWAAMSQGKSAIKRGIDQGLAADSQYLTLTGRQAIGCTANGKVLILTFPGKSDGSYGATAAQVLDVAAPLNLTELYMLDGGGSTQTMVNGAYVVPSSDAGGERAVVDAIAFYGATAYDKITTGWQPIALNPGFTATAGTTVPMYMISGGILYLRGSVSGAFSGSASDIGTIPPTGPAPTNYIGVAAGPGVLLGKVIITAASGLVTVFGPATGYTYCRLDSCHWPLA